MKLKDYIFTFSIAALIVYIIYLQSCSGRCTEPNIVYKYQTDTVRIESKPIVIKKTVPIIDTVFVHILDSGRIDSSKCVELAYNYYSELNYIDTVQDSNIIITSEVVITQNKISKFETSYFIKKPQTIVTYNNKPHISLLLTGNVGMGLNFAGIPQNFSTGLGLILKDKKGFLYGVGCDINTNGIFTPKLTIGKKLWESKR